MSMMKTHFRNLALSLTIGLLPVMASANTISIQVTDSPLQVTVTGLDGSNTEFISLSDLDTLAQILVAWNFNLATLGNDPAFVHWWDAVVAHNPPSVPEPGMLSLLGAGALGLFLVGWRRRTAGARAVHG